MADTDRYTIESCGLTHALREDLQAAGMRYDAGEGVWHTTDLDTALQAQELLRSELAYRRAVTD